MLKKYALITLVFATSAFGLRAESQGTSTASPVINLSPSNLANYQAGERLNACYADYDARERDFETKSGAVNGKCQEAGVNLSQTDSQGVCAPDNVGTSRTAIDPARCFLIRCEAASQVCSLPAVKPPPVAASIAKQQEECDGINTEDSPDDYQKCTTKLQALQANADAAPVDCKLYDQAWSDKYTTDPNDTNKAHCDGKAAQEELSVVRDRKKESLKELQSAKTELLSALKDEAAEGKEANKEIGALQKQLAALQNQRPIATADGEDQIAAVLINERDIVNQETIKVQKMAQVANETLAVKLKAASDKYNDAVRLATLACQRFLFSKGNGPLLNGNTDLNTAGAMAATVNAGGSSSSGNPLLNYRCQRNLDFQTTVSKAYQDEQSEIQLAQIDFKDRGIDILSEQQHLSSLKFSQTAANMKLSHDIAAKLSSLATETNGVSNDLAQLQQSNLSRVASETRLDDARKTVADDQKTQDANACWFKAITKATHETPSSDDHTQDRGATIDSASAALMADPCKTLPRSEPNGQCKKAYCGVGTTTPLTPVVPKTPPPTNTAQ